jgi:hypothetical protein
MAFRLIEANDAPLSVSSLENLRGRLNERDSNYYNSVSILGTTGKGKSFILNKAFGTNFVVRARGIFGSTTIGIDAAVANELIIFDVEGSDSVSRLEEEVKGETNMGDKYALLVLLVTDVIIMNLMMNDCYTYQGSGLKTLATIYKAAQQLDQEDLLQRRIKILFFVRDITDESADFIRGSIERLIGEVIAKTHLDEGKFHEMIDIDYDRICSFPNPKYETSQLEFERKIEELKTLLTKRNIFSGFQGLHSSIIPEVIDKYWEIVREESNLPGIRGIFSNLCIHFKDQVIEQMRNRAINLRREEPCLSSEEFSQKLQELSTKCEADFAELTQNLHPDINAFELVSQNLKTIIEENTLLANSDRCMNIINRLIEEMNTEAARLNCLFVWDLVQKLNQLEASKKWEFYNETTKFASSNTHESELLTKLTACKESRISQEKMGWCKRAAVVGGAGAAIISAFALTPIALAGTIGVGEAFFFEAVLTASGAATVAFFTHAIQKLIPNRSSIEYLLNNPQKLDEFITEMFEQITSGRLNITKEQIKIIMTQNFNKYWFPPCPTDDELTRVYGALGEIPSDVDREKFKVLFERVLRMALA